MARYAFFLIFLCFCAGCAPQNNASLPITGNAPVNESENLLQNPGFEQGTEGWKWLDWSKGWAPFALSTTRAYEGKQSLHLPILSSDRRPTVVWGGVQEIALSGDIPECIDGYYFVENWQSGTWKQYLQFVVIDLGHSLGEKQGNSQLRYVLTGSSEPPFQISNAHYLFAERRDMPETGKWVHFALNPRRDFQEMWQYTPGSGANLRLLFEGRFDHHETEVTARGDVYYDNLYFGPKSATRCAGN